MKKIKAKIGKILVILFSCLAFGTVVSAAGTASTEVLIEIEGSEKTVVDTEDNKTTEKTQGVRTGDKTLSVPYILAGVAAVGIVGFLMWKKKRKGFVAVMALFLSIFAMNSSIYAAEKSENVNLTIPSSIRITFNEDGTNSTSVFEVENHTNLPVNLNTICVTECNDWKLVSGENKILSDTKEIVFKVENSCLYAGENNVNIYVPEKTKKALGIEVMRGAWTKTETAETAMNLEFVYTFEDKQFQLNFDVNGGNAIAPIKAYNGEKVSLPTPERELHAFQGWRDEDGNIYKEEYVMPTNDVILTALWDETDAYAIYSSDDKSLTFVRSANEIQVGSTYNGKIVSSVYTGFETDSYTSNTLPWIRAGGNYGGNILRVVVEDVIRPVSTAYWFFCVRDCVYMDLAKLDMSKVTDMTSMFSSCGCDVKDSVTITGLSNWDTSNVIKMGSAFRGVAENASVFKMDDIGDWNTSQVTDMLYMFWAAGLNATWSLDLSEWNVNQVTEHTGFNNYAQDKVTPPKW